MRVFESPTPDSHRERNLEMSNQYQNNLAHEQNPEPGDCWAEFACIPYFVVLAYDKESDLVTYANTYIEKDVTSANYGSRMIEVADAQRTKRTLLFKRVHYNSEHIRDKYCAELVLKNYSSLVKEWTSLGSPFKDYNPSEIYLDKLVFLSEKEKEQCLS